MYPGAVEALDRMLAAEPGFALAHVAFLLILPLCNATRHCAVRWNTVNCPTVLATFVMICTPVPITATHLPSKLTGSSGQ
jgi:hypothetical protein